MRRNKINSHLVIFMASVETKTKPRISISPTPCDGCRSIIGFSHFYRWVDRQHAAATSISRLQTTKQEMSVHPEENGAKVRCISTATVRAANHTDSSTPRRLELTPWDLPSLAIHPIQKGLLFHKPEGDTNNWITHLKNSLSLTLTHFFPLAGRLATQHLQDSTVSLFIHCNNAGAEFIHAQAHVTLSDALHPLRIPRIVHDFFSLNGSINYDGRTKPLLSVQVTELLDGVFIGCTMNHAVADGASFWKFMNSWSEICKSKSDNISTKPIFNRWFLTESDLPFRFSASKIEKAITPCNRPPLQERIFHFPPHNVAKLKHKANAEKKTENTISSLQAVLAHTWISVTRVRKLDPDDEVSYRLLMSNRGRLTPELPEEYFGNAVNLGIAVAKAGELITEGLGFATGLLNQVVSSHTEGKICSAWKESMKEPRFLSFSNFRPKNMLLTGSSPRFNMYGNDFGWGCPLGVRSGSANKFHGKLTIYPGAVEGSMEIEACLSDDTLAALEEDSNFMEFVTKV